MSTGRMGRAAQAMSLWGSSFSGILFDELNDDKAAQIQLCAGQVVVVVAAFLARAPRNSGSLAREAPLTQGVHQSTDALREASDGDRAGGQRLRHIARLPRRSQGDEARAIPRRH